MRNITLFLLLLCTATVMAQNKTYLIDDPDALRDVYYQPGDQIILKNGVYDTDERMRFLGSGTAENPVIFRAETPGGVIFTGGPRLTIGGESDKTTGEIIATGEYLIVDGFHWKGGYGASNFIEFRNGYDFAHHSTIQNCAIDGLEIEPDDIEDGVYAKHRWIVLYGTYNSVLNCSFMNKKSAGALILAEYSYNAVGPPYGDDDDDNANNTRCELVGHTISNNYFYKYEKKDQSFENAGDSETIRIGTSEYQNVNSGAVVSNNYFVEADGENEIITNKSKNNFYINNTFRRSRGSLVLRHGSNATVEGNYFLGENVDGTGGIRITDSDHTITNNYIQDCITVLDQAKWNNGITFIGGGDDAAVNCSSTKVSNGYQQTENITVSRNTIVNTNAPLFYNTDKGSTDPTGVVSDNLIYFTSDNANISEVISGDTDNAYANLGTALSYSGNLFTGTTLGVTNDGFAEGTDVTATENGEIFTFAGADGKGADMGTYSPATDSMVGHGIGACFLNNLGANITNGDCTIEIPESIIVSSIPTLPYVASVADVTVTANVGWTAVSNNDWITIDPDAADGDATVVLSVTENTELMSREGSVTFTQVDGGDGIVRELIVTQDGGPRTDFIEGVTIAFVSKENSSKGEFATNMLDKDMGTVWTADDGDIVAGDYKGDGEYVILDLGGTYELDLMQFNTTDKSEAFGYQVWVSTTGMEDADFSMILPTEDDLLFTAINSTAFNEFDINSKAKYVKVIGFGRFKEVEESDRATADYSRSSAWTAIGEIEFFGDKMRENLINTGGSDDPVSVKSFSSENGSKGEVATNTLDKDLNTIWAAQDGSVLVDDYKGDGEYIIYDLGSPYTLDFIQLNTTDKDDAFGIQIWVSTTGTEDADFSKIVPSAGDLEFTATGTTDFNQYIVDADARYVKLMGYGRFNADGDKRESAWSAIGEIEFYGESTTLSTTDITKNSLKLYPNPVTNGVLYLSKQSGNFDTLRIYDVSGKTILSKALNGSIDKEEINVSSLSQGLYFVEISNASSRVVNKIVVSK
ncbi:chondroitinase-B domain-containing protein [Formosa sp. 4Alg 33]|uniref:chondroitinase-B domain-containing protein n=1 Tax=Formosa sp. 4Alg 33 TaxID=3382189 RepID=UPI003D9C43D7